jgi:hypothetical protein
MGSILKNSKMKFKMIHHVDQKTIDKMYNGYSPVFILSTGRSGSKFLSALTDQSSNVTAYHEPFPALQYFSDFAFHHQKDRESLTNMINAARMELILEVFIKKQIYVESNQCLMFFAPVIADLFKKSKFVHLIRYPGDFVRSAVRKGWHKNDSIWESGRVRMADKHRWDSLDHIEKLSWVWNTTNQYLEKFKKSHSPSRIFTLKIEDAISNESSVFNLLKFIGCEPISVKKIKELQNFKVNELRISRDEPENIIKTNDFPEYPHWHENQRSKVKKYCQKLAGLYGYIL